MQMQYEEDEEQQEARPVAHPRRELLLTTDY